MVIDKVYPWRERLEPNQRVLVEWTPPGSRVLEFGCATGYMTRVLRDERGCRVTGFEYSPAAAEAMAYPWPAMARAARPGEEGGAPRLRGPAPDA